MQLAYSLSKVFVTALTMPYKSTKAMVRQPVSETEFEIFAGVLEGEKIAPYVFIIC